MKLSYQKLHPEACDLIFGYAGDLGADICTPVATVIPARGNALIDTGLRIAVPDLPAPWQESFQWGCFVWSKSGLAVKSNIEKGAGVIDPNYTGALKIKLYNQGDLDVSFSAGDRIAQLVLMLCARLQGVQETDLSHLETSRGEKGFGSQGN
ncbi:MAG: dUTP diphosphatase [Candidatus Sericytochromatia bacterium]